MARITLFLNIHNFAAAQFFNHSANSAAIYNRELLFATSEGLFESTGDNDGYEIVGELEVPIPISAWVLFPTSNFGYTGYKTPRSMLLGGKFSDTMKLTITDSKKVTQEFTSIILTEDGCKFPLRSDQRSRYLKVKIENVDGSDFSLETMDLIHIPGPEMRR